MMEPKVAVIIPTRGKARMVEHCVRSLFESFLPAPAAPNIGPEDLDVVIMEQAGTACQEMITQHFADKPVRWMKSEDEWGFSEINNAGVAATSAPFVLLLNNDTIPKRHFLDRMVGAMNDPEIGIVGAKLLFPSRTIQHIGVVFTGEGVPYHIGHGKPDDGSFMPANRDDFYEAVTFACALIRRELWDEIGGLDPEYFFNYEDVDFCLRARELGQKIFVPKDAIVIHLESKSIKDRQTEKHSLTRNLTIFLKRWVDSGRLNKATGVRLRDRAGTHRSTLLNIAFFPGARGAGVPWWRVEMPARKIAELNLANVQMVYADQADDQIMKTVELADVAIFTGIWQDWLWRIARLRDQRSFLMVYDHDDHPIHMSPYADAYRSFGLQEIELQAADGSKVWLWRDGENGFDLARNQENRARQMEIMHLSDLLTTTTPALQGYLKTLNPNVAMLPNGIDFKQFRHMYTLWDRKPGPIRIGWHGGDNHWHDIASVAPWLVEFVNENDVELVLFGAYYRGPFRGIDPNKVVEEEWVHVEAFPWKLQTLGVDVAVIMLADPDQPHMKFNHYKDGIKFLEYSALRIPCVVPAGRAPYSMCEHGVNAMTYSTREEFLGALEALCRDKELRYRIASAGLDWTRENRDLDKLAPRWVEAFQGGHEEFSERRELFEQALADEQAEQAAQAAAAAEAEAATPRAAAEGS